MHLATACLHGSFSSQTVSALELVVGCEIGVALSPLSVGAITVTAMSTPRLCCSGSLYFGECHLVARFRVFLRTLGK
jgi:hypothetical protein